MAGPLAAVMVVVMLYCLGRALLPALGPAEHGRDVDVWHVLMAGAMTAMLLVGWSRTVSLVALAVFLVGVGWAVTGAVRRSARPAYLRLAVGAGAMAVMLLPMATAEATVPAGGDPGHATGTTGMAGMAGMDHATHQPAANPVDPGLAPPTALLVAALAALGVVLVLRLAGSLRPALPVSRRLDACCDVAMAVAMGYLLLMMS
jgi:hypothetical protein